MRNGIRRSLALALRRESEHRCRSGLSLGLGCRGDDADQHHRPPSSNQYPWNACRSGCSGCGNYDMDHAEIANVTSGHPGGANVLFGDGHVQFIKSSLSMQIWWALGTRDNGEVISSDSY